MSAAKTNFKEWLDNNGIASVQDIYELFVAVYDVVDHERWKISQKGVKIFVKGDGETLLLASGAARDAFIRTLNRMYREVSTMTAISKGGTTSFETWRSQIDARGPVAQ